MNKKFLFVGGSLDGETHEPNPRNVHRVQFHKELKITDVRRPFEEFAPGFITESYFREKVAFPDAPGFEFYRFEKLPLKAAVEKVFESYADKTAQQKTSEQIFDEKELAELLQQAEKATFYGEPIKDLSRETLIAAVIVLGDKIRETENDLSKYIKLQETLRRK